MVSEDVYGRNFDKLRSQQEFIQDASRKSSIDFHCREFVDALNHSDNYFTTSSCSGRYLAFAQNEDVHVKKNCEWIKVTHDPLAENEIKDFIDLIEQDQAKYDQIFLKFEPFILHVCCRNIFFAKLMLEQAIASGYRNSGISLGSSKIILAIRSTQNMETPISANGKLIVDRNYIDYVTRKANLKFQENFEKINRIFINLKTNCFDLSKDGSELKAKDIKKNEKAQKRLEKKEYFNKLKESLAFEKRPNDKTNQELETNNNTEDTNFNELFS